MAYVRKLLHSNSLLKDSIPAASALTAHPFSFNLQEKLLSYNFKSRWWIVDKVAKSLGINILPDQKNKGHVLSAESMLYNIDQTDSYNQLDSHVGHLYPKFLLTGQLAFDSLRKVLFRSLDSQSTNVWITKNHLDMLEIKYSSSSPVQFEHFDPLSKFPQRTEVYFDTSAIVDKTVIEKIQGKWPRSVQSGSSYRDKEGIRLLKQNLEKGYTSKFWITKRMASRFAIPILENEMPTVLQYGSEVSDMYNADQTSDPGLVARLGYQNTIQPRNAVTLNPYYEPIASKLFIAAARSKQSCSPYWLNQGEETHFGVHLYDFDDDRCVMISDGKTNALLCNVNMTSDPVKVHRMINRKKSAYSQSDESLISEKHDGHSTGSHKFAR